MTLAGSLRSLVQPERPVRPAASVQPWALRRPAAQQQVLSKEAGRPVPRSTGEWVNLGGVPVKLLEFNEALDVIVERATCGGPTPLAVASANLDHVKHFGEGSRWADTLGHAVSVEWLTLLDGAPLVSQAEKISHRAWPRLAGSDLIWPLLDAAETAGLRIGFLGGTPEVHALIQDKFATAHPGLAVAGWWAPERSSLADPAASRSLAAKIAEARTELLVVCLGKPRQELWISEYGHLTGAKVMLAFGAVVDFLAGRVRRAPARVRNLGLEWAWRLALEPRRLANRYLVDGPEAYLKLRRASGAGISRASAPPLPVPTPPPVAPSAPAPAGQFTSHHEHADVAVLIVTYNNAKDAPLLLESLREETRDQTIKVVVADNSPTPSTLLALKAQSHVFAFPTGGNLGYAGAINSAIQRAGTAGAFLVLNPDMRVERGSIRALRERMARSGAGVVVPLLVDDDGSVYPSLRREPSVSRAVGDALMGSRLPGRPGWLSEMDFETESYLHPHKVDWATGAALLIRPDVVQLVGEWDERYFLYSEETDFMHRVRAAGADVWFEPSARMRHCQGGSGTSPALDALMAANRIRYVRKFHTGGYARAFRAAVVLSAILRSPLPRRWEILAIVSGEKRWSGLPRASRYAEPASQDHHAALPYGSVIIPAHNEATVIARTLSSLAPLAALNELEVVVACNGCTDGTEEVLSRFPDVKVVSIPEASKTAALNAADSVASCWPRLYLDADIEISGATVRHLLSSLNGRDLLAARPASRYVAEDASMLVRAYYRARARVPALNNALWGGGVYGLSEGGHARLGAFPSLTADDYYVDCLFDGNEKQVLDTEPVLVRTPQTAAALLGTLNRVYRGVREQPGAARSTGRTVSQLVSTVRGPVSAFDAAVYAGFAVAGRWRRDSSLRWERDDSSRTPGRPASMPRRLRSSPLGSHTVKERGHA